jgi:hypothetical protein
LDIVAAQPKKSPRETQILAGASPMAPLRFPNLVVLGLIALWVLARHVKKHERVVRRPSILRGAREWLRRCRWA